MKNNAASEHIPWSQVAKHMGTRNANQCRSRWYTYKLSNLCTLKI